MPEEALPHPAVSIVMPVRNGAATVPAAIQSILNQTLHEIELLAVDDGSTDNTAEILRQFSAADPRVRPFFRAPRGIVAALQHGIAHSRAECIARMDADDWSDSQRLQRQLEYLQNHPGTGLVSSIVTFGGDRVAQAGYAAYVDWINSLLCHEEIVRNRFVESPLAHPSVMFRRGCLDRAGNYREGDFPEDYELWLRWLEAGIRMEKIALPLLTWNDPPHRLSRSHERYRQEAFYECKAGYLAGWLAANNPLHPCIYVWGSGRRTRKRAEKLARHGIQIAAYIDINPRSIGQSIHGRPVLSPADLPAPGEAFVVSYVGIRGARENIRAQLRQAAYRELRNFVMAA